MTDAPFKRIVLASASPRRIELLRLILPDYDVIPADVDETLHPGTSPTEAALRLAVKKGKWVHDRHPDALVIGADTVVEIEGQILGKPGDAAEAMGMLDLIQDRRHLVHTGVGIFAPGVSQSFVETTVVYVAPLDPTDIESYIATGEPFDKAGGYGIQGSFARYIDRIEGCFFNVMGLPVARLHRHLKTLQLSPENR